MAAKIRDREGRERTISSYVTIKRVREQIKGDGGRFQACVGIGHATGSKFSKQRRSLQVSCGWGRTPRVALSHALATHAKKIGRRRGAFAGRK